MEGISIQYASMEYSQCTGTSCRGNRLPSNPSQVNSSPHQGRQRAPVSARNGDPYGGYNRNGVMASAQHLSVESLVVDYQNDDGDTVRFEWAHMQYRKGAMTAQGFPVPAMEKGEDGNSMEKIMEEVKNSVLYLKKELIKAMVEANGGEFHDIDTEYTDEEVEALEAKMPEYWNAENTSQRIVDFATSFFGQFGEGDVEQFVETIRGAIETGFGQAKEMLGELPGAVGGLIEKTYNLTMEKLDAWGQSQSDAGRIAIAA